MICRVFLACVFMVNAVCWENLKFCPWEEPSLDIYAFYDDRDPLDPRNR